MGSSTKYLQLATHSTKKTSSHTAEALRRRATPTAAWAYLDGSAGRGGYRSAATVFFPNGKVLSLCLPSPFQSSDGADFWAAIMLVQMNSSTKKTAQMN